MAKSSKEGTVTDFVTRLFEQREEALALLKQSAADLDRALKDGRLKVGDRFTIPTPKSTSETREIVIVDNFADSNFVWRPLLIERFALKL